MKKFVFLAALLAATPVSAEEVLKYSTSVAGIPLGKVKIVVDDAGTDYAVRARFDMVSLLRIVFHGDATAKASGTREGGRLAPQEASFRYADRKRDRKIAIAFAGGIPTGVEAKPALRERSYDMPIDQAAGAIDPASAAAALMAPRAQPCALSFDVFDGSKRHRIALTGQQGTAQGATVTCTGLYERVAGFKSKYMTPERRSWPFVATVEGRGDGSWLPLKITARTKFGPASATLRR